MAPAWRLQESGKEGYWLAGGGVDPGESLRQVGTQVLVPALFATSLARWRGGWAMPLRLQGALREALEEAGVRIKLTGVLGVDVHRKGTWRRVTFLAGAA